MLSTVTGGQWFFPLIIVCLILGIVATIAQKKKLTKLKRITDNFAYAILVILLIIEWILYFQKQFNFITPAIYTLVVYHQRNELHPFTGSNLHLTLVCRARNCGGFH